MIKSSIKIIVSVILLCHYCSMQANNLEKDPVFKTITEINSGIENQLDQLFALNSKNNLENNQNKNWYIYFIGEQEIDLQYIKRGELPSNLEGKFDLAYIENLNSKLVEYNISLAANGSGEKRIYYGITGKSTLIPVPVLPFEGWEASSKTTSTSIIKNYYTNAITIDNQPVTSPGESSAAYKALTEYFNTEFNTAQSDFMTSLLNKCETGKCVALMSYKFGFQDTRNNKVKVYSKSTYKASSSLNDSISHTSYKSQINGLKAFQPNKDLLKIEAMYYNLTGGSIPDGIIDPIFNALPAIYDEHVSSTAGSADYLLLAHEMADKLEVIHNNAKIQLPNYTYPTEISELSFVKGQVAFEEMYTPDDKVITADHRLAYLADQTDTYFYVLYHPTHLTIPKESFNAFATKVLQFANIPSSDKIILMSVPYTGRQQYISNNYRYKYMMAGYSSKNFNPNNNPFANLPSLTGKSLYSSINLIYANIKKPYNLYHGYMRYDGEIVFAKSAFPDVKGKDRINEMSLYYDKKSIEDLENKINVMRAACQADANTPSSCIDKIAEYEVFLELLQSPSKRDYAVYEFSDNLKEKFFDDIVINSNPKVDNSYYANDFASYEFSKYSNIFPSYMIDFMSDNPVPNSNALYPSDTYQAWYDIADFISVVGIPFGADSVGEFLGMAIAQNDDDPERRMFNTVMYGIGLATIEVPAVAYKAIREGGNFIYLVGKKKFLTSSEIFSQTDEVVEFFSERYGKTISSEVATKIVANQELSQSLIDNNLLRKLIGERGDNLPTLLDDIADSPGLARAFDENPFLLNIWDDMRLANIDPSLRKNPDVVKQMSKFTCAN